MLHLYAYAIQDQILTPSAKLTYSSLLIFATYIIYAYAIISQSILSHSALELNACTDLHKARI